jgi:large subunit ribosomal protein L6e
VSFLFQPAVSDARKTETKRVDAALSAAIKATPELAHYLNAKFTLTRGQRPHLLKF